MVEIPEDVKQAARKEFLEYAKFPKHEAAEIAVKHVLAGGSDDMPMLELAARAILAERQRCADVALNMKGRTNIDEAHNTACDEIADAILRPPT